MAPKIILSLEKVINFHLDMQDSNYFHLKQSFQDCETVEQPPVSIDFIAPAISVADTTVLH